MSIIINDTEYQVELSALTRSYRREYKYRVTTEDGAVHSEVRATYIDFSIVLGNVDAAAYDRLMTALLATAGHVSVVLPGSQTDAGLYIGEFSGISDEVITQNEQGTFWDNLTLSFAGTIPAEVMTG